MVDVYDISSGEDEEEVNEHIKNDSRYVSTLYEASFPSYSKPDLNNTSLIMPSNN
jgi:hypothetical protein